MGSLPTLKISPGFGAWLAEKGCSLAISAYQSGHVFILGTDAAGKIQLLSTRFDRAMGLHQSRSGLWLATLSQIVRFVPIKTPEERKSNHDVTLVPQALFHTGYINAHEVAVDKNGRLLVVGTQFNSVMAVDPVRGLAPVWAPPAINELKAEDTIHLNGMCLEKGQLRFVTALGLSDEAGGWRKNPQGGCVLDCASGRPIATGLSRPHSPRIHGGKLWFLNSGRGSIGYLQARKFVEVSACPGYPRGLSFLDDAAVVGFSRLRTSGSGLELPIASILEKRKIASRCGVVVLDTKTGKPMHEAFFEDGVDEIFDVAILRGQKNPKLLKPGSQEAARSFLFRKPPAKGQRLQ